LATILRSFHPIEDFANIETRTIIIFNVGFFNVGFFNVGFFGHFSISSYDLALAQANCQEVRTLTSFSFIKALLNTT